MQRRLGEVAQPQGATAMLPQPTTSALASRAPSPLRDQMPALANKTYFN